LSSKIRFLQASCANPYIDCYCGNRPLWQNQPFNSCSEYLDIDYGGYSLIICKPNSYEPLVNAYAYCPENAYQTAIASGYQNLELFITPDGFNFAENTNKAYIRFIHLAYQYPCLDFRFTDGLVAIAQNIRYQSISEYYPLSAGTYRMQAFACNSNRTLLSIPSVTLQANRIYSFYITDSFKQNSCHYLLCADGCSRPRPPRPAYSPCHAFPDCNTSCHSQNCNCSNYNSYSPYNAYYTIDDYAHIY